MRKSSWLSVDSLTALAAIVIFSAYGLYGSTMESTLGVDFVGPDFFPKAIGIFAVSVGVVMLIQERLRHAAGAGEGSEKRTSDFSYAAFVPVGLMVVYALAFTTLGFPVATAIFLCLSARYLGCPSWLGAVAFAVAGTGAAVALFIYGLDVRLPLGVLGRHW